MSFRETYKHIIRRVFIRLDGLFSLCYTGMFPYFDYKFYNFDFEYLNFELFEMNTTYCMEDFVFRSSMMNTIQRLAFLGKNDFDI